MCPFHLSLALSWDQLQGRLCWRVRIVLEHSYSEEKLLGSHRCSVWLSIQTQFPWPSEWFLPTYCRFAEIYVVQRVGTYRCNICPAIVLWRGTSLRGWLEYDETRIWGLSLGECSFDLLLQLVVKHVGKIRIVVLQIPLRCCHWLIDLAGRISRRWFSSQFDGRHVS